MYELFLSFCLTQARSCQDFLLPSHGFETIEACEAEIEGMNALYGDAEGSHAICKPRPPSQYEYVEVSPMIFAHKGAISELVEGHQGDLSNDGFIIGDEGVLVIDSGGSYQAGTEIYLAIRAVTDKPILGLVLTHMHPDHVFGASFFEDLGVEIFGHENLANALASRAESYLENYGNLLGQSEMALSELPQNITGIGAVTEMDLGNRVVSLAPWKLAHTNNDLTVYDENSRVMFTGDLLFDTHTPGIDGSIRGWQEAMALLAGEDISQLVPGHGDIPLPFPAGFDAQARYFDVLVNDTKSAIENGERMGDAVMHIGQSEAPNWELFESYNPRNATLVFGELEWE